MNNSSESNRRDMDELYEHRLLSIDPESADSIQIILQWLAFADECLLTDMYWHSRHPLTLLQIAQVTIVDHSHLHPTCDEQRLVSPERLVELTSGILRTEDVPTNRHISDDGTERRLTFVDDTVREYLLSDRILSGPARKYRISEPEARGLIVNTCLAYILHITKTEGNAQDTCEKFPLAAYAALFWIDSLTENASPVTWDLVSSLFFGSQDSYEAWLQLVHLADGKYLNNKHTLLVLALAGKGPKGYTCIAPPIVWASALGLIPIVEKILQQEHDVNVAGPTQASALYMAVHQNHLDVVELLLKHGGDVATGYVEGKTSDYSTEFFRSPLYYASQTNNADSLKLLLQDRKKHGRPGWKVEIALGLAAERNNTDCLRLLINAGANINSIGCDLDSFGGSRPDGGCALQKAAWFNSEDALRILLDTGADVNSRGGHYDTALQAAAWRGYSGISQMLLEAGADGSLTGGSFGSALIASCWQGNMETTEMLLTANSDIDMQWDLRGHVLELNFRVRGGDLEGDDARVESPETMNERLDERIIREDEESRVEAEEVEDPASEGGLRKRIAAKIVTQAKYMKANFRFYHKCNTEPFKVLKEIRDYASRISYRLREAGVQADEHGRYFFSAIQAAVANERHGTVQLLLKYGATMPAVIVVGEEQASREAESIARWLRMEPSLYYEERGDDGSVRMSGYSSMPSL